MTHTHAGRAFNPYLRAAQEAVIPFDAAVMSQNASMQYLEWDKHGYGIVHLTATKAVFELWWQPIRTSTTTDTFGAQFTIPLGANHATEVVNPTATAGTRSAAPAPGFDATTADPSLPEVGAPALLLGIGAAALAGVVLRRGAPAAGQE